MSFMASMASFRLENETISGGPWIDSTYEAEDVKLAYRLYKDTSTAGKAGPRFVLAVISGVIPSSAFCLG